jgi:hypothetical protein
MPHHSTPELLAVAAKLWRVQGVAVHVIETGPTPTHIPGVLTTRLPAQPLTAHPSDCIAAACQLAQDMCETEFLIQTHVDVLPKRRDLAVYLRSLCSAERPVVGYEMSPRDHVPGQLATLWRGMVGHSLTICHVPTLRERKIVWDRATAMREFGLDLTNFNNWDTEVTFNLCLRREGILPHLIGHDKNYDLLDDELHVHCRSYPSSVVYPNGHSSRAQGYVDEQLPKAIQRIKQWKEVSA